MTAAAAHPPTAGMGHVNLLVVSAPESPELEVLKRLPAGVNVVAVGRSSSDFSHLTDEQWASVNVLLNCGVGKNAAKRDDIAVSTQLLMHDSPSQALLYAHYKIS